MPAVTALIPACVPFSTREIHLVDSARDFDSRSLDAPGLHAFLVAHGQRLPGRGAWHFEALALAAYYYHPSLDVARAALRAARSAEISAGARPNPVLGFLPGLNTSRAVPSPWGVIFDFDLPLETAGKRGLRVLAARYRTEAARLRLTIAAWAVRTKLREALLDLADAVERTRLITRQIAKYEEGLVAMRQKLAAGAIPARELSAPRTVLARLKAEREGVRVLAEESRSHVAAALGVPLSALPSAVAASVDIAGAEALATPDARRSALTSRADLLSALAGYAEAQVVLRLQVARQFPDLHLGPGYEFDQGESKWTLGLSIELPLFNQNRGPIAEAEARRREAATRVFALQATIAGEVEHAVAKWQGARQRLTAVGELVKEHKRRVALAAANLSAGAGERLDLLLVEGELAGAERLRWDASVQVARGLAALEAAIQRPLQLDFAVYPRTDYP